MIQFDKPIGSPADVAEIEYISALHQTNEEEPIRINGTIHAKDIRNYLKSRHGIEVTTNVVQNRVIHELCGTYRDDDEEDDAPKRKKKSKRISDEPMMDLAQMTALLMIGFLRQEDINEAKKAANSIAHGMAEQVLKLLLEELEHQEHNLDEFKAVDENFETGIQLTPRLLQAMFDCYGEYSVPDEILEEMLNHAAGIGPFAGQKKDNKTTNKNVDGDEDGDDDNNLNDSIVPQLKTRRKTVNNQLQVFWNKETFQYALTADIQHYHPGVEASLTTHLHDAKTSATGKGDIPKFQDDKITAQMIDFAADKFHGFFWVTLLWFTFAFHFICHMFLQGYYYVEFDGESCEDNQFGCDAAAGMVNALIILAQAGIVGFFYLVLGSLGNYTLVEPTGLEKALAALGVLISMGSVSCLTIIPTFLEGETFIWNTHKLEGFEALYWFTFSLGVLLICLQFIRLLDILVSPALGALGAGGRTRAEQATKLAATKKVNMLVENAMLLHVPPMMAGQKLAQAVRFPAKHASAAVIKKAHELHQEHELENEENPTKEMQQYREGNIQTLTGGEGSDRAMLNFREMADETEVTGGVLWAYERIMDGRLFDEEGIWLPTRLLTSTIIQWVVVALIFAFYFYSLNYFEEEKAKEYDINRRRQLKLLFADSVPSSWKMLPSTGDMPPQNNNPSHWQYFPYGHLPTPSPMFLRRHRGRHLQTVDEYNSTHYTDGVGVYPNIIYDANSTHFTDGTTLWPYNIFSHNGTHVFDKFYRHNSTHFTDGKHFYAFSEYATNGTHITNGEFLFDGAVIIDINNNPVVNNIEDWEYKVSSSFALVAAVLAVGGIAVVFIPSFVSTVIKFRCGIKESLLGGDEFQELRSSPDHVTNILGYALWGAVLSGVCSGVFVGGLVFLSIWSETRDISLRFLALMLGLAVIWFVKWLFSRLFRALYVSSFYRKHPAPINFINLVFECWNLVLGMLTMAIRCIKLSVITLAYIGRIDVPCFAPGVGYVGPYNISNEFVVFYKDLLAHEAHRHPFLERLGMMYLMKLYHGNEFGCRAGAYWRLLFVLALMPWMREYRVRTYSTKKKDEDGEDDFEDEAASVIDDGDTVSMMSAYGISLEMEITRRANESLTQRNRDLKAALADYRQRLRDANTKVAQLEREARKAGRKVPGLESVRVTAPDLQDEGLSTSSARQEKQENHQVRENKRGEDSDSDFESEDSTNGPVSIHEA